MYGAHKQLKVWQEAISLVEKAYSICLELPTNEKYGLSDQICRSATSIPANISEGAARNSTKDYVRFLYMARGSLAELDTHIEVCQRLQLISSDSIDGVKKSIERTSYLLNKQINALPKS